MVNLIAPMINLVSPINQTSYGLVSLNVLIELSKQREVTLWAIPSVYHIECDRKYMSIVNKALKNQERFDHFASSLRIWHQFDMGLFPGKGSRSGFPIFETTKFSKVELHHLSTLDRIVVTSQWAKEIIKREVRFYERDIHIVPLGVDKEIFYPASTADPNWTTFVNIGKWEIRKGHDILIKAFEAAFRPRDRVRLWMCCHNFFLEPSRNGGVDGNLAWWKKCADSKMSAKISSLPRQATQEDIAKLMNSADCGVFPSRAEGWNLELLEMMACGKNVIATDYSAHTEYAHDGNSVLIKVDELEEARDDKFFHGTGEWAKFGPNQFDQLVEYMRAVHKAKQEGRLVPNYNGVATADSLSWKNTADRILDIWN